MHFHQNESQLKRAQLVHLVAEKARRESDLEIAKPGLLHLHGSGGLWNVRCSGSS